MLGQDDNERIMGAKLQELGVSIQWNTELTAFEQRDDHVDAQLRHPDGTVRPMTATWMAGCDGSRSAVREMNHISFPGAPYAQTFFVADTEATGSMRPHELNVYLWRDGFHLFFPMRGKDRWRVIGILPEQFRSREHVTFEELIPSIKGEAGTDLDFKHCSWFSVYRIQHRAAERFRDRRCFLLGDAAHIHSPMGAQGMNTGLQDAYNLAWKLALVVRGRADAALLDTYEQERVPVAQAPARDDRPRVPGRRVGGLAAEAVADEGHRPRCGDRDEVRAGPAICLPDDFADRDQLSRQHAIASAWPSAERCARRGGSLPLGADQASDGRSGRGPLRRAR